MTEAPASKLESAAQAAFSSPFDGVLHLVDRDKRTPILAVDGRSDPPAISELPADAAAKADCAWHADEETLLRVLTGARGLLAAYTAGRLQIAGDLSLMARMELAKP